MLCFCIEKGVANELVKVKRYVSEVPTQYRVVGISLISNIIKAEKAGNVIPLHSHNIHIHIQNFMNPVDFLPYFQQAE